MAEVVQLTHFARQEFIRAKNGLDLHIVLAHICWLVMATVSVVWGNHLPVWGASKRSRPHRSPRCRKNMSGLAMVILILDDFGMLKKWSTHLIIKSPIIAYLENFGSVGPSIWLCHYRSHLFPFGSFMRVRSTFNILPKKNIFCSCTHSLTLPDLPDLSFAASHWHPNPKLSQFASFASQANERIHSKTLCSCVARPVGAVVATMRLCYTKVFELLSSSLLNQQERYKRASLSQTYWFCSISYTVLTIIPTYSIYI